MDGHRKPRFLVIGAGRRGTAYASAVRREGLPATIAAVAEPIRSTRISFGKKYVWEGDGAPREDQAFESWQHFLDYERNRRDAEAAGEKVHAGIDGIIVCTQDHTHKEILQALGPLKLHVLCEKPIATSLQDCQDIYVSLGGANSPERILSTGHVLRYSPHNMLLRRLLLEDRAIGEVISVEHTEPVEFPVSGRVSASRVGAKNMASSSGCAVRRQMRLLRRLGNRITTEDTMYNELPYIDDQPALQYKGHVKALLDMIDRCSMGQYFGVHSAHRHGKIPRGTVRLERDSGIEEATAIENVGLGNTPRWLPSRLAEGPSPTAGIDITPQFLGDIAGRLEVIPSNLQV
ncbi:hypothetical protein QQX98_009263 [Neonectria punicea]|uniref:Gfo/Idh/MocA-like oxidoreductase N-terminal domain-containing protein n=1 Tax=Neonectria punicea TaxID=979145 RepID=A0ABR1GSR7_9HYPO